MSPLCTRTVDFRYAPPSVWTAICRPDDLHKTVVDERGKLLYDYRHHTSLDAHGKTLVDYTVGCFQRVIGFDLQVDQPPLSITQSTFSARVPILRTLIQYPHARLELIAFGHLHDEDRRTDVVLWTVHAEESPLLTHFQVEMQGIGPNRIAPGAAGGSLVQCREEHDFQTRLVSTRPLVISAAIDNGPTPAFRTPRFQVERGQPVSGAIMVPLNHAHVDAMDETWARAALRTEQAYWNQVPLMPLRLEVPDPGVMDMLTSSARNILQAREIKGGVPEFQVGPSVYRGLWIVDGHFILEAAQYLGHAREAFHGLNALLKRVCPNGSIGVTPIYLKETAVALSTFVRQCELMGDTDRLKELWPTVQRAAAYLQSLRERSRENGPDAPEYGLMPTGLGDGGIGGQRPEYTNTLWILAGLKSIAAAARRLGFQSDAADYQASYDQLLEDFRRFAARDMQRLPDGTPYLSMVMPGSGSEYIFNTGNPTPPPPGIPAEPWKRINPATATWALAHAIYPGEVFAVEDPLVQHFLHLLDLVDNEQGVPAATGWEPYQSVWNYSASFYAHAWLYAGRADKAVDYLYAFANHAAPTRVWREEQSFSSAHSGYRVGDMPHNWASAEFIRLVRHLLVLERGEELELLAGVAEQWLVPGKSIVVERTPTRFGPVSLELEVLEPGRAALRFERDTRRGRTPERCIVHLGALKRVGIRELSVNGRGASMAGETLGV